MNFTLKKPDIVREAAQTGSKSLILELLIFVVVFFVTQAIMSLPLTIGTVAMMISNQELLYATQMGNVAKVEELSMELATSEPMMLLSLFATALMILVPILFCRWFQKRKARTLGFKKKGMWKEYGIGLLVGFAMMGGIVLICVITGAAKLSFNRDILSAAGLGMLALLLIGFLIQGMSEEVLCRGYFLVSLAREKGNMWMAVIVNAVAFGALHLMNPGLTVLSMVNLILFGIFASVYFVKRGNIWGVSAIHSIWNFAQGNLFGFLVSGQGFGSTLFNCALNEDMTLLNGGSFGLEGGILTTIVMVIGIFIMLRMPQKDFVEDEAPAQA